MSFIRIEKYGLFAYILKSYFFRIDGYSHKLSNQIIDFQSFNDTQKGFMDFFTEWKYQKKTFISTNHFQALNLYYEHLALLDVIVSLLFITKIIFMDTS